MAAQPQPSGVDRARELIRRHEGLSHHAYPDAGGWAIGIGHRLPDPDNTDGLDAGGRLYADSKMVAHWFESDFIIARGDAGRLTRYYANDARGAALTSMAFQMGAGRLAGFGKMLDAVHERDWETVHREALDSKWARKDTPGRAREVAEMLRTNKWPAEPSGADKARRMAG